MRRLTGWDASMLYSETPTEHMHTLKVAVVELGARAAAYTLDDFRTVIGRRLHRLPPFRYELVDIPLGFHHPMWRENCPIDLDYHIRTMTVAPRAAAGNSTRPSDTSRACRWTGRGRCGRYTSWRVSPATGSLSSGRSTTHSPTAWHRPTCWRREWISTPGHRTTAMTTPWTARTPRLPSCVPHYGTIFAESADCRRP